MKGFFVTKIVRIEGCWNFEQVIAIEMLIHCLSKNWGKVDRLPDGSKWIYVTHTLAISPEMSVENKPGAGVTTSTPLLNALYQGDTENVCHINGPHPYAPQI